MLTGRMVRVKYARDRIIPYYLDPENANWLDVASQLIDLFIDRVGCSRGELDQEIEETFGDLPGQLVHQGFIKLLQDRCEFDVVSGHPPAEIREKVFSAASRHREDLSHSSAIPRPPFDRDAVLEEVAQELSITPDEVSRGLFADLKSEQILLDFKKTTSERLLLRYNVALAQAVLLRSVKVHVIVRNETPARFRQLFRKIKFHRLVCEVERITGASFALHLDGPMSLFTATQKYGLQLAMFLPTILLCPDFELRADLLWGPQRKPKKFHLTPKANLVSHVPDVGSYVPPELGMFVELFRKRHPEWEIAEEMDIHSMGEGFWVPDFRLRHRESGKSVLFEVLGFWRRSSAEKHLRQLQEHAPEPFLLAVSDQLKIDEAELEGLPAQIHRFRQMPLPDEIARLAAELIGMPKNSSTGAKKKTSGKKKKV